jgi:hypothetical protein
MDHREDISEIATGTKRWAVSCNPKEQTTVQKLTNRQTTKKPTAQNGTFGFCRHTSQRSKNQKSHFFANALTPFRPKNLS